MRMFITSKNKYLSNDMKIFGTCSIPLTLDKFLYVRCLNDDYLLKLHTGRADLGTVELRFDIFRVDWGYVFV